MLAHWIDRLFFGWCADVQMSETWLVERLPEYQAYTLRQLDQGRVIKDVAATRRADFWLRVDAKRQPTANVREFKRASR